MAVRILFWAIKKQKIGGMIFEVTDIAFFIDFRHFNRPDTGGLCNSPRG